MLNAQYWEKRWQNQETKWDMGHASPPLVRYIDQLQDKDIRILIPGAGSAYEAVYLHEKGFKNVFVCDWAASSFFYLTAICPSFPKEHLIISNFFDLDIEVDLLLEQTFFCAIDPTIRPNYVDKAKTLLSTGGKIAGLLFGINFDFTGPPFGGQEEEYITLFEPQFDILQIDVEKDSIPQRAGNELFIEMKKRP